MTTLFVVGTPIGNLEDITLRALRILKEVDIVLCEDTRMTKKLLMHYGIATPTLSYHARSRGAKVEKIIALLEEGKNLALVSDAGTPAVSDPGSVLVSAVREHFSLAFPSGNADTTVSIVVVPGPSALTAALSVAGTQSSDFLFLGFLPHKKGRETLFTEIAQSKRAVVFYESPHRILKTLASLDMHVDDRQIVILRELTKIYEEVLRGTAKELYERLTHDPQKQRGEFVVIVDV
jgi:16S rRNA (cytidine1402-2'-O)-methyltransferase